MNIDWCTNSLDNHKLKQVSLISLMDGKAKITCCISLKLKNFKDSWNQSKESLKEDKAILILLLHKIKQAMLLLWFRKKLMKKLNQLIIIPKKQLNQKQTRHFLKKILRRKNLKTNPRIKLKQHNQLLSKIKSKKKLNRRL